MSQTKTQKARWEPSKLRQHSVPQQAERLTRSIDETARSIGVSRGTIYNLIRSGALRPLKVGGRTMFTPTEIQRFLRAAQAKGASR